MREIFEGINLNKERREKLRSIAEKIEALRGEVEELRDEEQGAYDNMPESLQDAARGESMQAAIELLDDAVNDMQTVCDALQGAQE